VGPQTIPPGDLVPLLLPPLLPLPFPADPTRPRPTPLPLTPQPCPLLPNPTPPPQDKERAFLKESFARVQDLEAQRVRLTQAVAASLSDGYARALAPLPEAAAALAPAISGIDGEAELAELHRVALDTGSAAEALAARQAHAIEDVNWRGAPRGLLPCARAQNRLLPSC
jgi:hypothetical protein